MKYIVKRRGVQQEYQNKKIFNTCFRACLNADLDDNEAKQACKQVVSEVDKWIKSKQEVTSDEIFKLVTRLLTKENKDAGFMYETHRDII